MTTQTPTDALHHRFKALSTQTNRMYAHAVVYGGHSAPEAAAFCAFVMEHGLNTGKPADVLELWYEENADSH